MRAVFRAVALLPLVVAAAGAARDSAVAQEFERGMSARALAELTAALDTIEAVTLGRDTLPWPLIRDSAFYYAAGARKPSDTYGAIDWALRRANRHSFLQASRPDAVSELIDGRYGYIRIPQRGGAAIALADSLHDAVRVLAEGGACGWVVDLRGNGGGNMWPMLAGIGPLLGDSVVGYFGSGPDAEAWYYHGGSSGILRSGSPIETASGHGRAGGAPLADAAGRCSHRRRHGQLGGGAGGRVPCPGEYPELRLAHGGLRHHQSRLPAPLRCQHGGHDRVLRRPTAHPGR